METWNNGNQVRKRRPFHASIPILPPFHYSTDRMIPFS
jgi:hypothetical protein